MKSKPANLKYTDLCIYIDKTIYNRDENNNPISLRSLTPLEEETVYNYLYNLISALSVKQKLLTKLEDVQDFSITLANTLFIRLISTKQSFPQAGSACTPVTSSKRVLKPIKSILNYVKNTIALAAVDFRKGNYQEVLNSECLTDSELEGVQNSLEAQVRELYEPSKLELLQEYFERLPQYIDRVVGNGLFSLKEIYRNNLRLSILITLNKMLTLPESVKSLSEKKRMAALKQQINNWKCLATVWDPTHSLTKELVIFNVERVFHLLLKDIDKEHHDQALPEDVVKDILDSALPTYGTNQVEDK